MPSTGKKKSKIIVRKAKRNNAASELAPATQTENSGGMEMSTAPVSPAPMPATTTPQALPSIPGFDVTGMSRVQEYAVRTTLVLCDMCVASSPERVADVIGRNFQDLPALAWFLRRIGKSILVERIKNKDIFDAARIVAHILHRQLKTEIGLPIPRW
jgi:hypothetical protein